MPALTWSNRVDRIAAFDALLCSRLRLCTACARGPSDREGIWMAEGPDGRVLAVPYALCARCVSQLPASHQVLDAVLRARYDVPEDEEARGRSAKGD